MTSEERNVKIKKIFEDDLELLLRKGHDYSGDGDCMGNLSDFGFNGVIVRIGDKYHRLKNFVKSGLLKVSDESVLDTLQDLRNYGYLAQLLYHDERTSDVDRCHICRAPWKPGYVKFHWAEHVLCETCYRNMTKEEKK